MKFSEVIIFILLLSTLLMSFSAAQIEQESNRWVGEVVFEASRHFLKIEPQLNGDGTLYYSQPNDWIFNQAIQAWELEQQSLTFRSNGITFDGHVKDITIIGSAKKSSSTGNFILYPLAEPDSSSFDFFAGNYQLPENRNLLISFQEALGTRQLFYSEGNNFVRLYAIAENRFFTPFGETISFLGSEENVTGLVLETAKIIQEAKKVYPYHEETFRLELADATIEGSLLIPHSAGPHPGIILGQGSGGGERNHWRLYADQFAKDGFVALVFDRRGFGKSTGNDGGLNAFILAEDIKALYGYLQNRSEVDPDRVGLWGFSNATWVMSLAAQTLPDVAFIAVTGASAVSQVEAEVYRRSKALTDEGITEPGRAQLLRVWELIFQHAVFDDWDEARTPELEALLEAVSTNEELKVLPSYEFPPPIPLEQFFSDFGGLLSAMAYAPGETYASIDVPVLFIIGELDENTAPQASVKAMQAVIEANPKADITLEVLPQTGHSLYTIPTHFRDHSFDTGFKIATNFYSFTEGYIETLRSWLKEKAGL